MLLGVALVVLPVFFPSVIPQVRASGGLPNTDDGPHTIPTDGGIYDTLTRVQIVTPTTKDNTFMISVYEVRWFMNKAPMDTDGLPLRKVETTPTNITWQAILQTPPAPGNHSFTFRVVWHLSAPALTLVLGTEDFSGSFTISYAYIHYDFDESLNWTVDSGTWSVLNGSLDGFSNAEGLTYTSDIVWKDCMLTAKVKIAADSPTAEAAFCVRVADSENFYWAGLGCWGHRVSISRVIDHVPEELVFSGDGTGVVKDVWYVLSIEVSGDTIMLYVNDVLELVTWRARDSSLANGGVGIRTWNSHILVDYITVSGFALTPEPETTSVGLKGVSWYGFDSNPSWYKMNEKYFAFLVKTFPQMNFLSLPVSAYTIMPEIRSRNYETIDYEKLNLLKQFVSWCESHEIKILISNYWQSLDEAGITAYWTFMTKEFLGESTIAGFDLINEPWAFAHGNEGIIELYERVIDAIRSIDPDRACYVQSMYYHYECAEWRNVLETNPVNRSNVVYVSHLYSSNYNTGEWYDKYTCPWVPYYLNHDYEKAKEVLRSTTEGGHGGLYERFAFIKMELGYDVAITEVAFLATEEGLTYGNDVFEILNEWQIDWTYHPWYANKDRLAALTYPDGTLNPQAAIVQNAL